VSNGFFYAGTPIAAVYRDACGAGYVAISLHLTDKRRLVADGYGHHMPTDWPASAVELGTIATPATVLSTVERPGGGWGYTLRGRRFDPTKITQETP
jgi:hypothetical protein